MPLPRLVATVAATVAVSAATVTGTAAPARADTRGAMIWGGTALELSTLGVFALNFGTDLVPNHGPGMIINFTPMVIAPAVGYGARNADPALPLAIHGAGWMGVDLFLLGTLIDGRGERDRMRVGAVAWTLGAVGAVAGGVLQRANATITQPQEGLFRVHHATGIKDFVDLEQAAAYCDDLVRVEAGALAQRAGAVEIQIKSERADKVFEQPTGLRIFIESSISATAFGRPGLV